uniref:Uncharacterized protein n=1 Tax=Oryza barthii TaxID=65489 RepID=A0A0D3G4W6_9ORYZ
MGFYPDASPPVVAPCRHKVATFGPLFSLTLSLSNPSAWMGLECAKGNNTGEQRDYRRKPSPSRAAMKSTNPFQGLDLAGERQGQQSCASLLLQAKRRRRIWGGRAFLAVYDRLVPDPQFASMELATGAMRSLLPKLLQLLEKEYGLQTGVREKIKSLSRELDVVHAVLRKIGDVPSEQVDELVKLWARDVREASYEMEDIVDTFLVHDDGPDPTDPHMLLRLRKKLGKLFKKSKARRKISNLIQDINKKFEQVKARHVKYTVDSVVLKSLAATTIDPRLQNLYKRATELVGIDGPRDDLINKLSLGGDVDVSDKKMKVISVVGFGGLVGRNPDMKKVFRDILIDLDKEKYTNPNMMVLDEKQLMDELKEFVKEKRCFIVIDDIWDKESWKLIRCALQESDCGSRLVITTRISEVATHAGEAYKIQPLSRDNSEKLLYARIVDGEWKYFDNPSAEACEKILKKCGGVPLAIITIASLLASKPGEDWSEVYNSIGFGHEDNDDVDHVIEKNSLIWKWIAEGFIHEELAAGLGLFELGERCFNELINRSMIQPVETKHEGYVDGCCVHDMVLDMIHSLSSEENFVTVLNGDERQKLPGSIARRLALQRVLVHKDGQLANITLKNVRSLIASQCFGSLCLHTLVLRVLDVINCAESETPNVLEDRDKTMPSHLGSLLHLRYLGLVDTYITKLPREVSRVSADTGFKGKSHKGAARGVGLLTQLVCLRADWEIRVKIGLIGKLTSLQELWIEPAAAVYDDDAASVDDDDDASAVDDTTKSTMKFVNELGLLRELRVLRTYFEDLNESMERALLESLSNLHNIRDLHIEGPPLVTSSARSVSCLHLRYLCLNCFVFSGLPAWIKSSLAPNLSCLDVVVLIVKEQDMETLARLPELRCLVLRSHETELVSIKIHTEDVGYFRKLRILRILGTSIWFDLHGSKCNITDNRSLASIIMPSLEFLEFAVHMRFLKDATQLGFDKLLSFEKLGRSSLQKVTIVLKCGDARLSEVEEVAAALMNSAAVHPKHPTVQTKWQDEQAVLSPYQEAYMHVSRTPELVNEAWKANIVSSGRIRALRMPVTEASSSKVICLLYRKSGKGILALSSNAVHKLWKWESNDKSCWHAQFCLVVFLKPSLLFSTTSVPPQVWQPESDILMNDTANGNPEEAAACSLLSKSDCYLISASGGKVSLFNMFNFKTMTTFIAPPPSATFLAFHPHDNNIIAIGTDDSSILLYNIRVDEVKWVLKGHQKKITGLVFSLSMNVLVSSGADSQLCVWSMEDWAKKKSRYIQPPSNHSGALVGDIMVQFHYDQKRLLVVHESQLAIYDVELECLCSWFPSDPLPAPVSSAVYSSDGLLIYAGFCDGAIGIFQVESLMLQCRIAPSAYIPSSVSSGGEIVYPMVVAAHPWKPNQFAVGMSDGAVHVLEPLAGRARRERRASAAGDGQRNGGDCGDA